MLKPEYAIYLGKETSDRFVEVVSDNDFFLTLDIKTHTGDDGIIVSKQTVRDFLIKIKEEISKNPPNHLKDLQKIIDSSLVELKMADQVGLSCGILVDNVFYILTVGSGEIYLKRGEYFEKILHSKNNASGFVKNGDYIILSSQTFSTLVDNEKLKTLLIDKAPAQLIEELAPEIKKKDDEGAIALFIKFEETESKTQEPESDFYVKEKKSVLSTILSEARERAQRGKKTTFLIVVILFAVLIWSVVFGYQRRSYNELIRTINETKSKITSQLNEASDTAVLNPDKSLSIIGEVRGELKELKKKVGDKKFNEITTLEKMINDKEKELMKKEDKNSKEFYDLALIEKGASGEDLYLDLDLDTAAILNSAGGSIYTLSVPKKSTREVTDKQIKGANLVASYKDDIFYFKDGEGIFKIDSDDKITQVIKKDDEWGTIADIAIYNGNIYLLDSGKQQIYKYLGASDGFSGKNTYFKNGSPVNLQNAVSMAIDTSIYVIDADVVYKFTQGGRDAFKINFPGDNPTFSKIFTNKETDKVYLLDKKNGKVFVVSKDGQYEKQISAGIFKKANDFLVLESEKSIYILAGDKIYTVGIE